MAAPERITLHLGDVLEEQSKLGRGTGRRVRVVRIAEQHSAMGALVTIRNIATGKTTRIAERRLTSRWRWERVESGAPHARTEGTES